MSRKLLLFDLDGTLLLDDAYAGGHAMERAAEDVYGVILEERAVAQSEPWGKTDRRIIRDVLRQAGLDDARIDTGMDAWMEAAAEAFEGEADRASGWWRVREHVPQVLRSLGEAGHEVAILSGNLEPIARSKVERMGLAPLVAPRGGAFGSERESRAELVPLARKRAGGRAGPWPPEDTVIVGDTPWDIAAAAADGARAVVFSSERFGRRDLAGGTVIERIDELGALL